MTLPFPYYRPRRAALLRRRAEFAEQVADVGVPSLLVGYGLGWYLTVLLEWPHGIPVRVMVSAIGILLMGILVLCVAQRELLCRVWEWRNRATVLECEDRIERGET